MKLNGYMVESARRDYRSLVAGVRATCPEALNDPLIAAVVLQIEIAEMALNARLDQLTDWCEE